MCERFSFTLSKEKTARRYHVRVGAAPALNFNISPGQQIAVVTDQSTGLLELMQWGMLPATAQADSTPRLYAAFSGEKLLKKPNQGAQLLSKRCLILADGFYLWKRVSKRGKVPYRVTLKWNMPFAFAGIWDVQQNGETQVTTCAIITGPANDLLLPFGEQVPLILPMESENLWLDPSIEFTSLDKFFKPYPSENMIVFPVSSQVNDRNNNSPDLIKPSQPADQFGNYVLFEK
jgi:putative SOS response-associated peptidase YedK